MGPDATIFVFWMLSFKPASLLSSFTFIKRLLSSSSLSAIRIQFSSVQSLSRVRLFTTPWIAARQASLCITIFRSYSDSRPSSPWCHPDISSSIVPFSSRPQSLRASEAFLMSQLFAWGGQSNGVSALASFLPKNTQARSPLEWIGWISLQYKGLSRFFSNTSSVQFSSVQLLSHVQLFTTPWIAARQASLSITNTQSSLRLTSLESVMP